jgi:hypothetical protein
LGSPARDHVRHDLGRLRQHHVGQLGLVFVDFLDRLVGRQILRRTPAVLAIEPLLLHPGALFTPRLEVQGHAVLLPDRVDCGDV